MNLHWVGESEMISNGWFVIVSSQSFQSKWILSFCRREKMLISCNIPRSDRLKSFKIVLRSFCSLVSFFITAQPSWICSFLSSSVCPFSPGLLWLFVICGPLLSEWDRFSSGFEDAFFFNLSGNIVCWKGSRGFGICTESFVPRISSSNFVLGAGFGHCWIVL